MDENVIIFPRAGKKVPPTTLAEVRAEMDLARSEKINLALEDLIPALYEHIEAFGFEFPEAPLTGDLKYSCFLVEALRSMLYSMYGMSHPFQALADATFDTNENNSVLVMRDVINIELKHKPIIEGEEQ